MYEQYYQQHQKCVVDVKMKVGSRKNC